MTDNNDRQVDSGDDAQGGSAPGQGGWYRYIASGWLVLVLAACFGGGLALVNGALKDRIAANKRNDTLQAVPKIVPGAATGEDVVLGEMKVLRAVDADGNPVGWVVPARGQGFADRIELLIGLDAKAENILGMGVLEQKETPGLGDKIQSDDAWSGQFAGKKATEDVAVVKAEPKGNQVRAITGATVSSASVTSIVNRAVIEFRNARIRGEVKE